MLVCVYAVLLPFLGTALGAGVVFFLKSGDAFPFRRSMTGFAAGVMTAASIWSLLIPAIERSAGLGRFAFAPATMGVWCGFLVFLALDRWLLRLKGSQPHSSAMLIWAVALHNLPEGMAVGVAAAGRMTGNESITDAGLLALSLGIAVQNLPEGAIISLPLPRGGMGKGRAFLWGVLSGVVELLGALFTLMLAELVAAWLPMLLGFSAGAMLYVVVEELIPEMSHEDSPDNGVLSFAAGFTLMMALDAALG